VDLDGHTSFAIEDGMHIEKPSMVHFVLLPPHGQVALTPMHLST